MGLSYVLESPYIMGLSYVLSIMGLSYVQGSLFYGTLFACRQLRLPHPTHVIQLLQACWSILKACQTLSQPPQRH